MKCRAAGRRTLLGAGVALASTIMIAPAGGQAPGQCGTNFYGGQQPPANQAPVARFGYSPSVPQANQMVAFDASASSDPDGDSIVNYRWDFGDGSPVVNSQSAQVSHSFLADALVTLTVTDCRDATGKTSSTVRIGSAPNGRLSLGGIQISGTSLTAMLSNQNNTSYTGTATLTTVIHAHNGTITGLTARVRKRKHKHRIVVGRHHFTVAANTTSPVVVSLNRRGKRLLRRFGTLPVRLTITVAGVRGPLIRTKVKFHRHKRRRHH